MAVAEGLCAGDAATDEAEVAGVPTEVFALDVGIKDRAVLALPECIFGVERGVMDLDVFRVLESVSASQLQIGDL